MKKSNGKNMLLKNIAQLYEVQKVIHKQMQNIHYFEFLSINIYFENMRAPIFI